MAIARIENNAVAEVKPTLTLDDVPPHKRFHWRTVGGTAPANRADYTGPTYVYENDTVRQVWTSRDLDSRKAQLKQQIDADAEACRGKYVTPGSGQAMTYQEKFAQAEAVDAMGEAAANALSEQDRVAQFPTLSASVGIEAATLWDCSQLVIARYQTWAGLSYIIEQSRLAGKAAIEAAVDVDGARQAYEAVTWP